MAKPKPEKKPAAAARAEGAEVIGLEGSRASEKPLDERRSRPTSQCLEAGQPSTTRILPMELQLGDRIIDATGEYEVIGRPYTTAAGKTARVRVKRVDQSEVRMIRVWGAHERVTVHRTGGA